ncbi:MAG: amidohydrolase family protein [Promethearchaeota archaeon]
MSNKQFFSDFGLIGDNLELKKNINIEINNEGRIVEISYDDLGDNDILSIEEKKSLMMPGFINSHVHIGDSFAKEAGINMNLDDVVAPPNGLKHRLLGLIPEAIKIKGMINAVLEMLSNGITFFIDFRENGLHGINLLKKALKDFTINYQVLGRFKTFNEVKPVYKIADGIGLPSYSHISPNVKELLRKLISKKKKIIACHDSELVRNDTILDDIIQDDLVKIIIHGTQYLNEDLKIIKEKKLSLVLCPRSNGYFGVGFPPIDNIVKLDIPISLGTDNVMVNSLDLFEEMRYLYFIFRVLSKDNLESRLSSKELLKMVTVNAAKNFELESKYGSISKDKFADFFIIDLNAPNFYFHKLENKNIFQIIVQRTKSENIKRTYIRGELVFERK